MRIALIGGGVIGGGWAGRLVENGLDVVVYDPHPEAQRRVGDVLDLAERSWGLLTAAPRRRGTVAFAGSLAEAVADADLVQESAPEDEVLKRRLLAEIDARARPDALISSSTSGLLPSALQADMARPERFVVGHPFNPVYLLPLVEVCGGARTSPETLDRTEAFYASVGMRPLRVRHEIDGFVADRLLEALWREALWLVHDGVATTAEIDDAITFGAGLRWAQMGTFLSYRIAGGEEGMRHFMEQFGPALRWPWSRLTEVPDLTDAFLDRIAEQSDVQADGLSTRELERLRDDNLVAILLALRGQRWGAGAVLARHEQRLLAAAASPEADGPDEDVSRPLTLVRARVLPAWVDYNDHLTESRYLELFAAATDVFLRRVGLDEAYRATGHSVYTVETHIRHLHEVAVLEPLAVTTQVVGVDEKRIHLFHLMAHEATGEPLATAEHMLLHVNTQTARATPMLEALAAGVGEIARAQSSLPVPEGAGRAVRLPGR